VKHFSLSGGNQAHNKVKSNRMGRGKHLLVYVMEVFLSVHELT